MLALVLLYVASTLNFQQASCQYPPGFVPPFLLQTTPVQQVDIYYPQLYNVFNCSGVNEGTATYQPWYSYFITSTTLPTDNMNFSSLSVIYSDPSNYPVPATPIDCFSASQLRNGSCTDYYTCVYVMNGTINTSPQCPSSMYCCMLPSCALVIGAQTRYGHCRPKRTCPGIFDTVMGISVGCPDVVNAPCCVAEDYNITCPRNYDRYVNALVKAYGLLNTSTAVATPQRVLAWAPYLLSVFDDTVGVCIWENHKVAFLQFVMDVMSEMFMFTNGTNGMYKRLLDWKGVSMGLLPPSYFSYYSPYVFTTAISALFKNYNLAQSFGTYSFLSAHRIFDFFNKQINNPFTDYTSVFSLLSWRSYKYFARFLDCVPAMMDGAECSTGQGMCFVARNPKLMNTSEYWRYCPKQLTRQNGDCLDYPSNAVCCVKPYPPLKFGANLAKNEFNDVVVAIHQSQFLDASIITDLVRVLTGASSSLYRATRGRAYFRTITILSQWNGTNGNATYETYRNADIKVVPEFYNQARSVQLGRCGEPGLGVFLSQNQLRQWGASQTVAKLFAMNRWGFGDEVASTVGEAFYVPDDQYQGSSTLRVGASCSANVKVDYQVLYGSSVNAYNLTVLNQAPSSIASFAFRPDLFPNENAEFCATTTIPHCDDQRRHNPEPNTPHNRICNRTSTLTTIFHSEDFDQTQNSPRFIGNTAPVFKFVQYPVITSHVIAIIADLSGSISVPIATTMVNAIVSFLHIVPDEVEVVLVTVAFDKKVNVDVKPATPLNPYFQPTGGWHFGRQQLIEKAKGLLYYIRSTLGPKNTSVLAGIERVVETYTNQTNYRVKMLVMSDFYGIAPSNTRLQTWIQKGGYSIWPLALWSPPKLQAAQEPTQFPLYYYMQSLANSTYGRWQFIANATNITHWFYGLGTFLDDNNYGMPIMIENYNVTQNSSFTFQFKVPPSYTLNTSIVIDYDSYLYPVTFSGSAPFFQTNCSFDERGYQRSFRIVCRLGDLATGSPTHSITLNLGSLSNQTDGKAVTVFIVSRAYEYGSAYRGQIWLPSPWVDPWQNQIAATPDSYPKGETRLTRKNGLSIVFERSPKFRYPTVFAILSLGQNAIIRCTVEYDLYVTYSTTPVANPANPPYYSTYSQALTLLVASGKMYDDGKGEDGFADDGVYTALLNNTRLYNGTYSVHVHVRNTVYGSLCQTKPGNLVGFVNNVDTVTATNSTPISFSFYKAAGGFDVFVPSAAQYVFPLGVVTVLKCDVFNVTIPAAFFSNERYKLPTTFSLFCTVRPLEVETRYGMTSIIYNMAVSAVVSQINQQTRYWANASGNSSTKVSQSDGTFAFNLSFPLIDVQAVPPVYYAVVWAYDNQSNYATRSNIFAITVPTMYNNVSGLVTYLPLFTDITTPYPRPDDAWPGPIIASCIMGIVLAFIVLVVVIFVFACRRKSEHLVPPPPRPYGNIPDNRLSIISGSSSNKFLPPSVASSHHGQRLMPGPYKIPPPYYGGPEFPLYPTPGRPHLRAGPYSHNRRPQSSASHSGHTRNAAEVIFGPAGATMEMPTGTAERQNMANVNRQARYRRSNDEHSHGGLHY